MERMFSFARRLNREPNFHPSGFMTLNSLRGSRVPPRDRSMGEIHRAAMVGNLWRMRKILFFRSSSVHDRDTWSRTALHVACAHGHPKVARLLVNRKCLLDLCDVDKKTALIQAVQHQQEKCATILLDHDANPNVADISGNTALHYAVLGENVAIVEKLLSCSADMHMINKDGLTPLSLAQRENKVQMVSILLNSGAALPTVNEMESNQQQTSENEEGRRPKTSSERRTLDTDLEESPKKASRKTNSRTVDENPKEDSLRSNPGLDNSWDLSADADCKDKLTPLSLAQHEDQEQTVEFLVERKASTRAVDEMEGNPGLDNSWDLTDDQDCKVSDHYEKKEYLLHENHMLKDENAKLRLGKGTVKNQNQEMEKIYFENIKIVKEKNDDLHKKIKHNEEILTETTFQHNGQLNVPTAEITMLNLKLENEKQNRERLETEVESYKSRLATAKQHHKKCQASKRDLQLAFQRERDEWFCLRDKMNFDMSNLKDNNEILSQELFKAESKFSSLETELNHTRDDLRKRTLVLEREQRTATRTQCYIKEMEQLYKTKQDKLHKNIVKQRSLQEKLSHLQSENMLLRQQLDAADNKADNKEKTVINTQDQFQDIINTLQTENEKQCLMLNERNKELTSECSNLKKRIYQYENDKAERDAFVSQLQQELADTLRKQSVLEASLEVTSRDHMNLEDETQNLTKKLDENRSQVSDHYEKKEYLLHENHMLKDENAKLRLGKGTVKNQNQEMEKIYFENIKIVKEKNDDLHKKIKHNEEILTETTFQHNGQLNVPTAEITMLNLKLENEKQNRERLETEVESYKSRLATAKQDHEQCQASKRDLQLACQRERDEWFRFQYKMNFDMSNLKDNNEILSQELFKAESKFSSLETELNHTRDDLRKRTLVLEREQRAATRTQCYINVMDQLYKRKRGKLHKNIVKQRSLQEKLSHLQSENMLLRQQLDTADNKADNKEKTVINTQDQFQNIINALQTENEKKCLMLNERNKELTSKCSNLKKRIYQYENDKAERDAFVSQLQQELADTLRKQSVLEASLEVTSRAHMNLEDETQDFKEKLDENKSQVEEENKKQKTHKKEVEGNIYHVTAAVSDGIIQQTKSTQTDYQQYPMENEYSDRFILKEDKEKKQKSDLLYEEETEQLRNKEQLYTKEVEINPQLKTTVRTQEMEMNIISDSYEKEYLLHENHMLQDENAKLRLEIDTVKNQNQEMEKKHFEDIKIFIEKNDHLNKTIQRTEEILNKTISQHNVELTVLTGDLENEGKNRGRLEAEVESYKSRLATATQDHEQCQASKRDLQLAFQRERDEWFCLRDKMNFDMSNLKDNNEILSQELSKAESKFSSLEIELNHTRDDLRKRTLVLEREQRAATKTQCYVKEMEHMYEKKLDKLYENIVKQRSLEKKLSHLQSENMLLRQQLDAADNKADNKEKTVINTQDQFQDIIKALQTENEKQCLMLNERNKELTSECSDLKKRLYQYENDKAERDAVVAQIQQDLVDTLRNQCMSEALLDVMSRHRMNLEDETQDLKRKLDESRSHIDDLTAKLEDLTASSKCLRLDEEKTFLQQELLSLKEKCEKLENENQNWKQEVVNLKRHMQTNTVEFSEVPQYQRTVEERAQDRQEVLFTQTQTSSQACLEPDKEDHNTSTALLKLRVEELEFELSSIRISQDSKSKKYKKLYLQEVRSRKALTRKLKRKKEQLTDVHMELLLKEEDNRFLHERIKQETSHRRAWKKAQFYIDRFGTFDLFLALSENWVLFWTMFINYKVNEEENLSMWQEFEKNSGELKKDAAEFECESYRAYPVGSVDQ